MPVMPQRTIEALEKRLWKVMAKMSQTEKEKLQPAFEAIHCAYTCACEGKDEEALKNVNLFNELIKKYKTGGNPCSN